MNTRTPYKNLITAAAVLLAEMPEEGFDEHITKARRKLDKAYKAALEDVKITEKPEPGALDPSELATVLHGLRMIQTEGRLEGCAAGDCEHFQDAEALGNEAIDELCERLNCSGVYVDWKEVAEDVISWLETGIVEDVHYDEAGILDYLKKLKAA